MGGSTISSYVYPGFLRTPTFDSEGSHALVDRVQCIFYIISIVTQSDALGGWYRSEQASRCEVY